jgi:hypothetical protein
MTDYTSMTDEELNAAWENLIARRHAAANWAEFATMDEEWHQLKDEIVRRAQQTPTKDTEL